MIGRQTDPIPFIGAFESTYQPVHDRDVVETTEHHLRWRDDLRLMAACHVRQVRYPLRWHRIEPERGRFEWRHTDQVLGAMHDNGLSPIVDLLHHTSYPRWLGDLSSPELAPAYERFVSAVARRYPWLPAYTVCNEPFTTLLMCGQEGVWPPHGRGMGAFAALSMNVMPALSRAANALAGLLPDAQHVHVEVAERHSGRGEAGARQAATFNDRRFFFIDVLVGRPIDADRPFVRDIVRAGGEGLLGLDPCRIDVLGLDYYAHNQWHWHGWGRGTNVSPRPAGLADLIGEYSRRYQRPVILGETNIRGFASDRATWLKYTLEQCELARTAGHDVRGYCWFPFLDSADWASLLVECVGAIDPVGVFWLDQQLDRRSSSMSVSYTLAASGVAAAELPAYRFRQPVSNWLAGWMPQMSHWHWQKAPASEACSTGADADLSIDRRSSDVA